MTTDDNEILPEHVALNRARWDECAAEYAAPGERSWALAPGEETWGIFGVPEADLHLLPDDLAGFDAIELGCGTGYISAWSRVAVSSWAGELSMPTTRAPRRAIHADTYPVPQPSSMASRPARSSGSIRNRDSGWP